MGDVGDVGGAGDDAVAHAVVQKSSNARANAGAVKRAGLKPGASEDTERLFVGVFEVRVPVQTVFVEAQEAS